ncbi:hypothetical protein H6P81_015860 [Aristolochia fimbriata]|uniref:Pectinesterase inhibitor domain-containing protein n=1 Tax=Aristolochia fimbriata TaxID=158543 RepID=A0AAV7E8U0_ARIFI|nr:hypothetical protein H6P81_015860 [Aristolochia fimbriata]
MATPASFSLFQFLALLVLFSLPGCANSYTKLVNRICGQLKVYDMVDFCVETLESDSRTATAANLVSLGHISLNLAITNATDTRVYIKQLLVDKATGKRRRLCLKGCEELYGNIFYDAEQGGKALQEKKYEDVIEWGVAIAIEADRCEEGFRLHPPMESPLSQRNKNIIGIHLIIVYIAETLIWRSGEL